MHDRTTHKTLFTPFEHLQFRATSCTLRGALFHIVACILMHEWFHLGAWFAIPYLMHDRTAHRALFNPFEHLQFRATSCTLRGALFHTVACILMHEWCHLSAWFAIPYLMHDRATHGTSFNPFEHLQFRATSCTLRGALFHIVACILMHDRTTRGTLFNPFEHLRFRATSCTLRWFSGCYAVDFYLSCGFLRGIKWCGIAKVVPPTGLEPVTNRLWVDCSDRLSYGGGKSVADYREFCR